MKEEKLVQRLQKAIAKGKPFGPKDSQAPKMEVSSRALRRVLISEPGGRSRGLWLQNAVVTGELDLEGCEVAPRMGFSNCSFELPINVNQASIPGLTLLGCELPYGLSAAELAASWGVRLDGSRIKGVILTGSKIEGHVSMVGATIHPHSGGPNSFSVAAGGIEVSGSFDCEATILVGPVSLVGAQIGGTLDFSKAKLQNAPEAMPQDLALSADGITVRGPVFMTKMEATGEVRMLGASITGQFSLDSASINGELALLAARLGAELSLDDVTLNNPGGTALLADRLSVDGAVFCNGKFRADGDVRLPGSKVRSQLSVIGATINGELCLSGSKIDSSLGLNQAKLTNEGGNALLAERLVVKDGIYGKDLSVLGGIRLTGARIGSIVLVKARISNPSNAALSAEGLEVDAAMRLISECVIEGKMDLMVAKIGTALELRDIRMDGEVNLQGASVGGDLALNGAKLQNDAGPSLRAERLSVDGSLFMRDGFKGGEIRLGSAKFGAIYIQDSSLTATKKGAPALHADGVQIIGSLFCERTDVTGQFRFPGADIGSQLSLKESTLHNEAGTALSADRVRIGHGAYLDGMTTNGEVSFTSSTVDGQMSTAGAALSNPGGTAIDFSASHIEELMLSVRSVQGEVDLRRAELISLWDAEDGKPLWPSPEELRLEGLSYRVLREPLTYKQRLEWVEPGQEKHHYPGVYEELANNFRRIGRSSDARAIAIAGERRAKNGLSWWSARRAWSDLLYVTIGYGYRNWLAVLWLVALVGAGALAFCLNEGQFTQLVQTPPPFNPILYAMDATVPVLEVGQQRAWGATGAMAWVSLALAISGYVLATAVIAAAAGLLGRDQNSKGRL